MLYAYPHPFFWRYACVDYFRVKERNTASDNLSLTRLHFTESGYLMLVKSLTDDLSWAVQRELVNSYFRANLLEQVLGFLPAATRKLIYYRSLGLTQKDTASLLISNADQHLGGQCLWILHKKLDEDIDKLEAIIGAKISVALDQELIRM